MPLEPALVDALGSRSAVVLDIRHSGAFATGHVPGSVNIGLAGEFASWAGTLIPADRPLVIVADDEGGVGEAALRLARVGLANVAGYLEGGIGFWAASGRPVSTIPRSRSTSSGPASRRGRISWCST